MLGNELTGIFRKGDIVSLPDVWGKKMFVVESFIGNNYLPLMNVHFYKRPINNGNRCLFDVRDVVLINSNQRPLKHIEQKVVIKLYLKKNIEATREFIIRKNSKIYV